MKTPKQQVGGSHYATNEGILQPIEIIEKHSLHPHEANVVKYIARCFDKNQAEDLDKAVWYVERMATYKREYGYLDRLTVLHELKEDLRDTITCLWNGRDTVAERIGFESFINLIARWIESNDTSADSAEYSTLLSAFLYSMTWNFNK